MNDTTTTPTTTSPNATTPTTTTPTTTTPNATTADHYVEPGWFTRRVFNPMIAQLTRWGISVWGSRVLEVRGRTTGEWRSVPVNVLELDGERYLVAPRGVTAWVRNVRAAGSCRLRVGRRVEEVMVEELDAADAAPVLRAYLRRWKWEVGAFFDGLDADAPEAELAAAAPKHPTFRLSACRAAG
jgi:deazaflavin-dependent oxidoreductase (nitroreductase family)